MQAELQLTLMGKPRVSRDGVALPTFTYNKSLALLAYLAVTGRPHSRETLAGLLWGEMPDENARANLRKALADLRRDLSPFLTITRQTVALNCDSNCWLDIRVFESNVESLKPANGRTPVNEPEVRLLTEASDLYTGDLMEGFYVHDAPAFEEWMLLQRERLRELQVSALHTLARYYADRGAYEAGIGYTGRLLALEPWHEEFHQEMMLLLAMGGQRSAALRQYEICRNVLQQELGIEPSPEIITLHRKIQNGEIVTPAPRAQPHHNIAAQMTPFIGRESELQAIARRLGDRQCRMLTLTGISGAGKTRLAMQAACDMLGSFKDGAYTVTLAGPVVGDSVARCVADSLGLCLEEGEEDAEFEVLSFLHDREVLLVLDNAEYLADSAQLLQQILERAPRIKLLLASLEPLRIKGEWLLPVQGLSVPRPGGAPNPGEDSAFQLFLTCAQRHDPDFAVSDQDHAAILRICELVEGLPLAIELASAWVRMLPCEEIAREIEANMDFLLTSSRSVPERHRSLRSVFAYSVGHLSDEERDAFCRLSVLGCEFSREEAETEAGASLPVLAALLDRCLIYKTSLGQYSMHDFLRTYAAEMLAATVTPPAKTGARYHMQHAPAMQRRGASQGQRIWQREAPKEIRIEASPWRDRHAEGPDLRLQAITEQELTRLQPSAPTP